MSKPKRKDREIKNGIIWRRTLTYRGISYEIIKFEYGAGRFRHGFALESKERALITAIYECMKKLGIDGFCEFLWDDAQHTENSQMTEHERITYLNEQAEKQIDKFWEIYENIDHHKTKRFEDIIMSVEILSSLTEGRDDK